MKLIDFSESKVLVIGDIMLDRYYFGSVSRISPEAPVPVVAVEKDIFTLGGAGNVANNILTLQANCKILATASNDSSGNKLKDLLNNIKSDYIFIDNNVPTTTKLRIIGEKQQIVRVDFESVKPLSPKSTDVYKEYIKNEIKNYKSIVISDYGKGVCTEEVCSFIINQSKLNNIPVIIDPKGSDWSKYKGATIVTPNLKELIEVAGKHITNTDYDVISIGREIREKYDIKFLVVTRSEKGITIISCNEYKHIPTTAMEVFDVSGAGDTVVATMAVALGSGYSIEESVELANSAAGVVVGKVGTAPILIDELRFAMNCLKHSKIIPFNKINLLVDKEKLKGKKIIFTNGCFDILHKGHVDYLNKAKGLGDILILGLNSDNSVKRLKGDSRPINNEDDRAFILSSLEAIDYVTIFEDDTPLELIKIVQPDILVKGGDYSAEEVVGREYAKSVEIIKFVDGYSTTNTIKKLKGDDK